MTEALVSFVVEELGAIVKDEVGLLAYVKKELESISSTFSAIQALLVDAERKQVTTEVVRVWLEKIKEVAYEVEDILDEWRTNAFTSRHDEDEDGIGKIQKVRSCLLFPCLCFKQVKLRHDIGHRIREVRERLNEISKERSAFKLEKVNMGEAMSRLNKEERETSLLIDESEIFGRDEVKEEIIRQLVGETGQKEKPISIVSIVGMGGLGKTTLAQQVCNDKRVEAYFKQPIWVCVSDPPDVNRVATKVIKSLTSSETQVIKSLTSSDPDNLDLDTLLRNLCNAIDGKLFLLVLDDVWDENGTLWQKLRVPLKSAAPGSRIVVTTRSLSVAEKMETTYIHDLGVLSNTDCWKLFKSIAFKGAEDEECQELTEIGEKIVGSCKGVPLAIRALGSLLHPNRKKSYWKNVLESEIWKWDLAKDNGILPALLLSYYNLPPHLQRCFSFCSMFPKDYEIEKDELVKLWMAHGIIESVKAKIKSVKAKKDDIEEIGEIYFDDLLTRSLFQDAEKDENGNIVRCKMHDLVHDLATFVSSGEYCSMEVGDSESCSVKCHHLSLLVNEYVSFIPSPLCNAERLRTLLLFGYSGIEAVPDTLFTDMRFLRVLDLSRTQMKNLPSSLGKLKHLRYLSLCWLNIKELPEFVTDLCNLQTLKLNACASLCILPSGMSKMVKLRHLEIQHTWELLFLPKGLGRLSSLRTLSKFPVGDENGGCKIGELKDLNLLKGELSIEKLERVMNVEDASKAKLHEKSGLQVLSLCCSRKSDEEWRKLGNDEMERMYRVLEGLTPLHTNLKQLTIENYVGSMFPNWLEDSRFSSLVEVKLEECKRLSSLPEGLGQLKALQTLKIWGCERLSSLPEGLRQLKALQTLEIWGCKQLLSLPEGLGQLKALQTLEIRRCEQLSSLPEGLGQLKALQTLHIEGCDRLSSLPEGLGQLKALQTLHIKGHNRLSSLPEGLGQLKALQTLHIEGRGRLSSLPEGLGQLKALQTLRIEGRGRLSSLPEGLGQLKALQTLHIKYCERLSSLPKGLGQLKALLTLQIWGCERLSSLPEELGQLKALQRLQIWGCEQLSSLFDGFEQLKSLCSLDIKDCPQLRPLPNLQRLTALKRLSIGRCPLLTERLEKEKGEDWCKISHIPSIHIDDGDTGLDYMGFRIYNMIRSRRQSIR